MNGEFPDVVQLSVRGEPRTTLLSTLTKDEGSTLAAMFIGQHPVYKDDQGRYFIDAHPASFDRILQYLRDGEIPNFYGSRSGTGFGFGAFGGGGVGLFGRPNPALDDAEIRALYKEATFFGIKGLVSALEEFKPILIEKRLQKYRKSKNSYEECISRILSAINGEEILYGSNLVVQLRQESHTIDEPKCCEHNCIDESRGAFGSTASNAWESDIVVTIPPKLDVPLFRMIFNDLQSLGYNIQGRLAICHFRCTKRSSKKANFGGFGSHNDLYCCMEKLYLIQFALANSPADNLGGVFQNKLVGGGCFGPDSNQGTGLRFGSVSPHNATTSLFGKSEENRTTGFGAATPFGGAPAKSLFQQQQQQQPSGFSFGAPTTQQPSGSIFGGQTSTTQQPSGSIFGGQPPTTQQQQPSGFSLGASSPTAQQQGCLQNLSFGAASSSNSPGGFGKPVFGQTPGSIFPFAKPAQNQAAFSFSPGFIGASKENKNKKSPSGATPPTTVPSTSATAAITSSFQFKSASTSQPTAPLSSGMSTAEPFNQQTPFVGFGFSMGGEKPVHESTEEN